MIVHECNDSEIQFACLFPKWTNLFFLPENGDEITFFNRFILIIRFICNDIDFINIYDSRFDAHSHYFLISFLLPALSLTKKNIFLIFILGTFFLSANISNEIGENLAFTKLVQIFFISQSLEWVLCYQRA